MLFKIEGLEGSVHLVSHIICGPSEESSVFLTWLFFPFFLGLFRLLSQHFAKCPKLQALGFLRTLQTRNNSKVFVAKCGLESA